MCSPSNSNHTHTHIHTHLTRCGSLIPLGGAAICWRSKRPYFTRRGAMLSHVVTGVCKGWASLCATVRPLQLQPCVPVRYLFLQPCATMRPIFFLPGNPLKCLSHPMMVFIGTTPEGWGLLTFFLFANKSCCTKRTKKQTQGPSGSPPVGRQAYSTRWIYFNNNSGLRRWVFGATVGCGSRRLPRPLGSVVCLLKRSRQSDLRPRHVATCWSASDCT